MQTPASQPQRFHWPSFFQLAFSGLAALASLGLAFVLALGGMMEVVSNGPVSDATVSYFLLAGGAGISGLLLIPSIVYAFFGLQRRSSPFIERLEAFSRRFLRPAWWIFLLPVVLLAGWAVSRSAQLAWVTLPVLHILAVGLPILWLVFLGLRGLSAGPNQRAWGVFGLGLIGGPALIMVFEIVALGSIFLLGVFYVALNPELAQELESLAFRLQFAMRTPEDVLPLISPYLSRPLVLFAIFAFTAGIVPLIEEIFKPLGVWLLAGSDITPAEGFAAGLLSGAGYALFESLALSASVGENWTAVVLARVGTGLLHIVTTGLTGWALAGAWRKRRYFQLGVTYLGMVFLHGLWNGMALLSAAQNFRPARPLPFDLNVISRAAAFGLVAMAVVLFFILLSANSALRRSSTRQRVMPGEPGFLIDGGGSTGSPQLRENKENP